MSLENKLHAAATNAAIEATKVERARCLWVLDELLKKTASGLHKKLMSPTELHIANVRFDLTKAIVGSARTLIATGIRPPKSLGLAPTPPLGPIAGDNPGDAAQAPPSKE